jgi:hypothetical protein
MILVVVMTVTKKQKIKTSPLSFQGQKGTMEHFNSYSIQAHCTNCGQRSDVQIKRGSPVSSVKIEDEECSNCGCKTLQRGDGSAKNPSWKPEKVWMSTKQEGSLPTSL